MQPEPHEVRNCARCGIDNLTVFYFIGGKPICQRCRMKIEPPEMLLIRLCGLSSRKLYNATYKCYESKRTVDEFIECGWFLRRIKDQGGNRYYSLEYYGSSQCPRCEEYHFLRGTPGCLKAQICIAQATQR